MQGPLVSIIIPNYNHALFLKRRIESVLSQTYQNTEVIILDDYSNDESRSIIKEYESHPKIVNIVFNTSNSGSTFKQWNKGVQMAKGDYVWLAESDDEASPYFIEKLMNYILTNNLALAFSNSNTIDNQNNITGDLSWWLNDFRNTNWENDFIMNGSDFCSTIMVVKNAIMNASSVVFSKNKYLESKGANENMKLCGDWDLWVRLISNSKLGFVSEKLNFYRFHDNTVRATKDNQMVIFLESLTVRIYCFNNFNVQKDVKLKSAYESLRNLKTLLIKHGKFFAALVLPLYFFKISTQNFSFGYNMLKSYFIDEK